MRSSRARWVGRMLVPAVALALVAAACSSKNNNTTSPGGTSGPPTGKFASPLCANGDSGIELCLTSAKSFVENGNLGQSKWVAIGIQVINHSGSSVDFTPALSTDVVDSANHSDGVDYAAPRDKVACPSPSDYSWTVLNGQTSTLPSLMCYRLTDALEPGGFHPSVYPVLFRDQDDGIEIRLPSS